MDVALPDAGFYLWAGVLGGDDVSFTVDLLAQYNVAVLPGSYLAREAHGINPGAGRVRMTREELAEASELTVAFIAQLESIGIVWATPAGHYDEDALAVASVVARLSHYGVEPRHLKTFRVVADRERGLVEQMATPYSNPRDRDGRAREQEVVRDLAALIVQLHATLLRAELMRSGRA